LAAQPSEDFQFIAENSVDIICRTATDTTLLYVSPSCLRILGWTAVEMTGRPATDFILPDDLPTVRESIERCNTVGVDGVTATIRFRRKDAVHVWMEVNARAVRDSATGDPTEHVIVMRDITERKLLEEKLSALALTDGLTGLANRRAFDEDLDREWKRTLREGSQISLLLIDIDHFKAFNDRYGHQFGDDCLRAVAVAVAGCMRPSDTTARYGGEEIAVILPTCDIVNALEVAEQIRATVEALQLSLEEGREPTAFVTISIGVATALARHGGTIRMPESLLLAADNALYKAKHAGRNQCVTAQVMAYKHAEA
jgi:diguanylate cyclase (GGDEF)-like protein/PAS domain S-box-containing protein